MVYLTALALAITSNLDDLGAGLALGLTSLRLGPGQAGAIAAVSGLALGAGLQAGRATGGLLAPTPVAWASPALFALIASYFLYSASRAGANPARHPSARRLSGWGVAGLALALGADSLFLGVPAGLAGYPPLFTPAMGFLSSYFLVMAGNRWGQSISLPRLQRRSRLAAAAVFALLALAEASRNLDFPLPW